jgi:hypothetical protein
MGQPHSPTPVLLMTAAFSCHPQALAWARGKMSESWGPIALESEPFDFSETDYYRATMGTCLKKQFFVFQESVDPARLVQCKLQSNGWEAEFAAQAGLAEERPLNLDPGYITLAKLVLASTKDHAHRIYLGEGIYAEITLNYRAGGWQPLPWTYPDYRRGDFQAFFSQCREFLKGQAAAKSVSPEP